METAKRFLIQQQARQDMLWAYAVDFAQSDYVDDVEGLLVNLNATELDNWPAVLARAHPDTLRSVMSLAGTAFAEAQSRVCQRLYDEKIEQMKAEG